MSLLGTSDPQISKQLQQIPNRLYFRIGDVSELLGVKPYVLRYWETEFSILHPTKSKTGQRVYQRKDVENLILIKHLLYSERYSIEGARKRILELRKEGGLKEVKQALSVGPVNTDRVAALQKIKNAAMELLQANREFQK